jgi:hypothetical protein
MHHWSNRIALFGLFLLVFTHFVTDHTPYCRANTSAQHAAAQQVTRHTANHSATRGGLVLVRHIGATTQAQRKKHNAGKNKFGNAHVRTPGRTLMKIPDVIGDNAEEVFSVFADVWLASVRQRA